MKALPHTPGSILMREKPNPKSINCACNRIRKKPTTALIVTTAVVTLTLMSSSGWAQEQASGAFTTQKLGTEIIETLIYSLIGIIMAVCGFKVVDWLTPGSLAEEVAHKENRALAILAGSMMLGVCIIIASVLVA